MLFAHDDTVVTDTRTGPRRTTELVGVRGGDVVYRTALDCLVANQGSCLLGEEVYVSGTAPAGQVLRSVRVADGTRNLDVARSSRDLLAAGERLLVLDSINEPGVVSLDRRGGDQQVLVREPTQEFALAGNALLAAVRVEPSPQRIARLVGLDTATPAWEHRCHGASIGLDNELAFHIELDGGQPVPVAQDTRSGSVRWRGGAPLGDDTGTFRSAGSLVTFTHGTGTTVYSRETGAFVAELVAIYALAARGRHLVLEGSRRIACVDGAA